MKKLLLLVFVSLPVCTLILSPNSIAYAGRKTVRAYVTNFGGKTVSVIDTVKNIRIADIQTGIKPHGVSISPDGKYVFVSNEGDNTVSVVDPSINEIIKQIDVGRAPNQLAVTRDGQWVYVTNHEDGTVSVIEVSNLKVVDTIPVGEWPHIAYPSFDGSLMYVTSEKDQKIVLINIDRRKVVDEIFVYGFPRVMDVSKDGKIIYLTLRWLNGTLVVDIHKRKVVKVIELARSDKFPADGKSAHGLALTSDGKTLYITSQVLNTVSMVNTETLKIEKQITVGDNPNWIGFTPDGKFAYVSNTNSSDVSVIDVKQGRVIKSIPVGSKPKRLAVGEIVTNQASEVNTITWSFDKETVGKLPRGFSSEVTGKGVTQRVFESIASKKDRGQWEIVEDKTAPSSPFVLAQTSDDNFGYHFNLAVVEKTNYKDLELEVKFKAVSGKEDQGGGPVWRYQDPDNYYIARANPLEGNFRFYKVVKGKRKQLASANLKVTTKEWHSIKIRNRYNHIECFYDGEKYLDINDDVFKAGKIGLWTKADAVTYFDDFVVKRY